MGAKVPVPVGGVDIYKLPLTTMEGFVLSRVDGSATCDDIAMMTSVQSTELDAILDRLEELGALKQPWKAARARRGGGPPQPAPSGPPPEQLYDEPESPPDYELSELDDPAEINLEARRRILNAFHMVDDLSLYQVLGLTQKADKKKIRAAYFALSKRFHPDAFFGKDMGAYEAKIEHVFKRLTEAYETLGRAKRREEYDQYLATTSATLEVTEVLAQAQKEAEEIRAAPESVLLDTGMPSSDALRPPKVPDVARQRPKRKVRERGVSSPDQRRKAAAARLRRGLDSMIPPAASSRPPPVVSPAPPPPPSAPPQSKREKRESVIKELARTLTSSPTGMPSSPTKIGQYLEQAKTSEERGDVVGASNALQLALAMQPDNEEVKAEYDRVTAGVAAALAGNYEKQARYEERVGKWTEAAESWARVVEGRPEDATANRSAALCLLRSSGDLHLAQRCAETAVRLQPDKVESLVALAEVYLGAGLKLNARRELEKAVKLDEDNDVAKNLLREAK